MASLVRNRCICSLSKYLALWASVNFSVQATEDKLPNHCPQARFRLMDVKWGLLRAETRHPPGADIPAGDTASKYGAGCVIHVLLLYRF